MAGGIPTPGSNNIGPSNAIPSQTPDEESSGDEGSGFQKIAQNIPSSQVGGKPSPMSVAQSAQPSMQSGQVSADNLVTNMQQLLNKMGGLKSGLQTPNLQLNARTRRLLEAKLNRTKDNIQFVHSKVNVGDEDAEQRSAKQQVVPKAGDDENSAAIGRFLGYLTDGQSQLESAMQSVSSLKNNKDPGLMLQNIFSMQVKMYRAQVEIEFSTAVLQKAVDDLKTLMNVQL